MSKWTLIFALALGSCDSCLPESFRVTQKAGFERMAIERHTRCIVDNGCAFIGFCHRQSEAWCADAGYAITCGNGEVEGSCDTGTK